MILSNQQAVRVLSESNVGKPILDGDTVTWPLPGGLHIYIEPASDEQAFVWYLGVDELTGG